MKEFLLKLKNKTWFDWFMLVFPISIFYYESVFRISTVGDYFKLSTLFMLLFCVAYGAIGYLLSTIFKSRKANKIIACVLLGLTAVFYLIEYFVFKFFKVFYDINTITGGAGDMMGGFLEETFQLIFSVDGIFKIILFAVPTVLVAVFSKRVVPVNRSDAFRRITAAAALVVFYSVNTLFISLSSVYYPIYKTEYNFQSAVGNFGLVTGVRLDVKNFLFGDTNSFETPEDNNDTSSQTTSSSITSSETEQVDYGFNQLDLDLSGGSTSKIKELNQYVSTLTASKKNEYTGLFKGKNLIMITAEAFTAEVIDPELTPTLYRLATKGINFTDYYQPASAGTTGGEYQNIFGMMPTAGGMSFKNTADNLNYFTMGSQLNRLGYYGMAYHNNSYTYYSRHKTHINLGYSGGFMGYGNGMEQYVKKCWPQSDLEMIAGTLPTYIDKQPFNVYYMSVSGHSGYNRAGNAMTAKNWDTVKDLPYSDQIKGYLAANLELENALAHLVSELENKGIADDTVICIGTDHFPYGLDQGGALGNMPYLSELYGYNVTTYFERDHSRLIIWSGCLEDKEPIVVDSPTFSLDILPTLSNLFGTEFDSRLMPGRDVFSDAEAIVFNMNYNWKTDLGTFHGGKFTPADENVEIPDGYVDRIKTIVRNKIRYCSGALDSDYFAEHFGE
ncbi:MAG: LTA synthase family protein [Oscillospiraceae bacterium]|nr:LTA synthase family protein [Oscillospiraceae bacterium]